MVEGPGNALTAISTYIDLNPVRAGIVEDPADYMWSSYGKAVQGDVKAMEGIFQEYRDRFGHTRKHGAHRVRGLESTNLYSMRNLAKGLFG